MQNSTTFLEEDFRIQAKTDGITHISTGVAILRDGKILMVRRVADDFLGGSYELPGGGVDEGETITDGAIREVKEETGLVVSKIVANFNGFDYSTDKKPHVRQVNFIVEVEPGDILLSHEHDGHTWADKDNFNDINMSDSMRKCVTDALELIK